MRLDHVALATRDLQPALAVLVTDLGGILFQGAEQMGFRSVQVRLGDATRGMTVELLEPFRVEEFDFLARFLDSRGAGPHHLTFKVDDLAGELDRLRRLGVTPTGVSLDSPRWKEAFLTPDIAHGTVVQLAEGALQFASFAEQLASAESDGPYGEPRWWTDPGPRAPETARLERVVLSVASLDEARAFYAEVLRGTVLANDRSCVDITWTGGAVRLVDDPDHPPGIIRLDVRGPGPARSLEIAGAAVTVNTA